MRSLGIRRVFDLRTDAERAAAPPFCFDARAELRCITIGFDAWEDPVRLLRRLVIEDPEPGRVRALMRSVTLRIALEGASKIGEIVREIAAGAFPAAIHCSAGKDRTGVVCAILLKLVGVSETGIYRDYLLSNVVVPAMKERFAAAFRTFPDETVDILVGVNRGSLDALFETIESEFGSFQRYVSGGLRLTEEEIAALRARLLVSSV